MTDSGTLAPPWGWRALFDGTGYAFSNSISFPTGAATVCLWLKWSPPAGQFFDPGAATLFNYNEDPDSGDTSHRLWLTSVDALTIWWSGTSLRTKLNLADGAWHFLAVTFTPAGNTYNVQIYVDGTAAQAGKLTHDAGVTFQTGRPLVVGMRAPAGEGDAFAGYLSGLSVWNSALTPDQVLNVMATELQGNEQGLTLLWSFQGPPSNSATGGITYVADGPQELQQTEQKGLYLEYEQLSQSDWQAVVANAPLVPTSFAQVEDMATALFSPTNASPYVLPPQTTTALVAPEYQLSLSAFNFPTGAFTVGLWVKWNTPADLGEDASWSTGPASATLLNYDEQENDSAHRFWITAPSAVAVWFGGSSAATQIDVADGRWHHLAFVVTPSANAYALTVIRDGISVYTGQIKHDPNVTIRPGRSLVLGQRFAGDSNDAFCGSFSDFAIWNRALTLSEVRALLKASPAPDASRVLYWPLTGPVNGINERGVDYVGRFTTREMIGGDTIGYLETNLLYNSFLVGIGNPAFDVTQIQNLDLFVSNLIPDYAKIYLRHTFGIFELITDSDPHSIYYLTQDEIDACGQVLVDSQTTLTQLLGRGPYVLPAERVISVIFDYKPGAANPLGQIYVQGELSGEEAYRENVLTHELFHSFQYAFGLQTVWRQPFVPPHAWAWIFEGTARWCEVKFYQRILFASDLTALFIQPDMSLFDAAYATLPFWISFEALGASNPARVASIFRTLFTEFERVGDPILALGNVAAAELQATGWNVGALNGIDYFFGLFAVRRVLGSWGSTDTGTVLYPAITDLDGNPIRPLLSMTDMNWTATAPSVSTDVPLAAASSVYLAINFDASMQGVRFNLQLDPPANTAGSFALIRRLGTTPVSVDMQIGQTVVAQHSTPAPTAGFGLSRSETIDRTKVDNWVLIVNGMAQNALQYTLKLWNGNGGFPPPPPEAVNDLKVRIVTGDAAFAGTSLQVTLWLDGEAWTLANNFSRGTTREFDLDPRGLTVPEITSLSVSVSGGSSLDLLNPWLATSVSWLLDGVTLIVNGKTLYNRQGINVWLGAGRDSWGEQVPRQP
jgi:hypothetical protein